MKGWLGIALFVAVYDAWAGATGNPTLSREFRDNSRSRPAVVGACTAFMVAHLYGLVPRRVDPLCIYIDTCGWLRSRLP